MEEYKQQFINLAHKCKALQFGKFKLKSGRISPYFFNGGMFFSGQHLKFLGECYAQAIIKNAIKFDVLFGPAYKGIGLTISTAIALADRGINIDTCYDRKEIKDHGEGGMLVGANIENRRVLIIDDVITAGTAIKTTLDKFSGINTKVVGAIISLNRQETDLQGNNAIEFTEKLINAKVYSIINFGDLEQHLIKENSECLVEMELYRRQYGVS